MIFIFFYITTSKTQYEYVDTPDLYVADTITLFLDRLDVIEYKVKRYIGTFLSYWKDADDLYLFVDSDTTYGPFNADSGLAGIYFESRDYTVRLVNDGPNNITFQLSFSRTYPYFSYDDEDNFPITKLVEQGSLIENLTSPFIYYIDRSGLKYVIIIMGIILGILSIIAIISIISLQ